MSAGTILLVDDETKILNALASALREEGHEVVATSAPREAQKLLGERLFDLLIVDNLMPGMTGLELQEQLAAARCHIPIIFISAHDHEEARAQAFEAGAVDFLHKPFSEEALLNGVRLALKHMPENCKRPKAGDTPAVD